MKKVCKNCKYFAQVSFTAGSNHIWGDCVKTASSVEADDKKERGVFVWDDKTCSDFKPKQEPG